MPVAPLDQESALAESPPPPQNGHAAVELNEPIQALHLFVPIDELHSVSPSVDNAEQHNALEHNVQVYSNWEDLACFYYLQ